MKWTDISNNERYLKASPEKQREVQNGFFTQYVEPKALEQGLNIEEVKNSFYNKTNQRQQPQQDMPLPPLEPLSMKEWRQERKSQGQRATSKEYKDYRKSMEQPQQQPLMLEGGVQKNIGRVEDFARSAWSGIGTIPRYIDEKLTTPVADYLREDVLGKEPLSSEQRKFIDERQSFPKHDPQYFTGHVGHFAGDVLPYMAGLGAVNIARAPQIANTMLTGATQGGIAGLSMGGTTEDAAWGAGIGAALPPVAGAIGRTAYKTGKNLLSKIPETAGISGKSLDRVLKSDVNILSQTDEIASADNLNRIATNLRGAVDRVKSKELAQFKNSKAKIMEQGKNIEVPSGSLFKNTKDQLVQKRLDGQSLTTEGLGGTTGNRLKQIIDTYSKKQNLSVDDLMFLKTNELDSIINYKPGIGQTLAQSERDAQAIARQLRRRIDATLSEKLGPEYRQMNRRVQEMNQLLEQSDLKSLISGESVDKTASGLRTMLGNARGERATQVKKVEQLVKNLLGEDINVTNDIMDYLAASDIERRIDTGKLGGFTSFIKAGITPTIEEIGRPLARSPVFAPIRGTARMGIKGLENLAPYSIKPYVLPQYNRK